MQEGKAKAKSAHEEFIAKALVGGAGMAHRLARIDNELPPLRLVFKEEKDGETHFLTDPIEVAILHSLPWTQTWNAYSKDFNDEVARSFKVRRKEALHDAKEAAEEMDTRPNAIRNSLKLFSSSTALNGVHLKRMASLPDVALEGLGAIFKQSVSNLTVPAQELFNMLGLLG